MYLVLFKTRVGLSMLQVKEFEMLDEAKDFVKELYHRGTYDVKLTQEIPMKVTVSVEF